MTSKPDNTHKVDEPGRQGLRPLELFETIATEIERKHRAAKWLAEIPAEWTTSIEERVASEIAGWPDELSGDAKAGAPSAAERIARGFASFKSSFEGAYKSLMEAMFPDVIFGAGTPAMGGATRLGAVNPGATGAAAPQDHARERSLSPEEEKVRAGLPAWVVVECAVASRPGTTEFAILWTGQGPAPTLQLLELRLNGQPRDGNLFYTVERSKEDDEPQDDERQDKVTFVIFKGCKPKGFTVLEREDGRLVIDFMT